MVSAIIGSSDDHIEFTCYLPGFDNTPCLCVLDTGAEMTFMSKSFAEELYIDVEPLPQHTVNTANDDMIVYDYTLDITLPDGKTIRNVKIYIQETEKLDYNMIIGFNIIRMCDTKIIKDGDKLMFTMELKNEQ